MSTGGATPIPGTYGSKPVPEVQPEVQFDKVRAAPQRDTATPHTPHCFGPLLLRIPTQCRAGPHAHDCFPIGATQEGKPIPTHITERMVAYSRRNQDYSKRKKVRRSTRLSPAARWPFQY